MEYLTPRLWSDCRDFSMFLFCDDTYSRNLSADIQFFHMVGYYSLIIPNIALGVVENLLTLCSNQTQQFLKCDSLGHFSLGYDCNVPYVNRLFPEILMGVSLAALTVTAMLLRLAVCAAVSALAICVTPLSVLVDSYIKCFLHDGSQPAYSRR